MAKQYFLSALLAGTQYKIGELFVSYNPDNGRFYVCAAENGTEVMSTFNRYDNAIRFAKTKSA